MLSDGSRIVIRHVHSAIGDLIQKTKNKKRLLKGAHDTRWGELP